MEETDKNKATDYTNKNIEEVLKSLQQLKNVKEVKDAKRPEEEPKIDYWEKLL